MDLHINIFLMFSHKQVYKIYFAMLCNDIDGIDTYTYTYIHIPIVMISHYKMKIQPYHYVIRLPHI